MQRVYLGENIVTESNKRIQNQGSCRWQRTTTAWPTFDSSRSQIFQQLVFESEPKDFFVVWGLTIFSTSSHGLPNGFDYFGKIAVFSMSSSRGRDVCSFWFIDFHKPIIVICKRNCLLTGSSSRSLTFTKLCCSFVGSISRCLTFWKFCSFRNIEWSMPWIIQFLTSSW